jgi:hypothetical protein
MPDPISTKSYGGQYSYDENGAGRCEGAPVASTAEFGSTVGEATGGAYADESPGTRALVSKHSDSAKDIECALKAAKASAACGGAALAVMASAPTLVGGVVASFIGGAVCGLEVVDTYLCYSDE